MTLGLCFITRKTIGLREQVISFDLRLSTSDGPQQPNLSSENGMGRIMCGMNPDLFTFLGTIENVYFCLLFYG